jgi:hypothetical protein
VHSAYVKRSLGPLVSFPLVVFLQLHASLPESDLPGRLVRVNMLMTIRETIEVALREHDNEEGRSIAKAGLLPQKVLIYPDLPDDFAAYTEALITAVQQPAQVNTTTSSLRRLRSRVEDPQLRPKCKAFVTGLVFVHVARHWLSYGGVPTGRARSRNCVARLQSAAGTLGWLGGGVSEQRRPRRAWRS